jgi:predicted transcriptional regulator
MTTDVRRVVATAVEDELLHAGRSTRWLAEQVGITEATIRKKLAGEADFTIADLAEIAVALDISVARLTPRPH